MNHGRQQELDFPRGEQLALLRAAVLPATVRTKHGGVRGSLLKSVLKAIDDHGRGRQCYVKAKTLAIEVGCSLPHIKRAIEALESMSLICRERKRTPKGPPCNHYWIVWNELALLDSRHAARQSITGDTRHTAKQSITMNEQSIMVNDQSITGETCNRKRKEAHKEPPPPTAIEAKPSDSITAVEVEEDDLICHARGLGLFDVNAVNAARANGWNDVQLRQLFVDFEQRRRRWDAIRNPCGLLRTWLQTLPPAIPIPWPDAGQRSTQRREPTDQERANKFVMTRRKQMQDARCDLATIELTIRRELQQQGFTAEVCRAAGYSIDDSTTAGSAADRVQIPRPSANSSRTGGPI